MIRLVRVELSRFFARRAIVGVLLLGVLVTGVLAAKTAHDTRPPSPQEVATATAQADLAADDSGNASTMAECVRDPAAMIGPGATDADCAARLLPSAQSLLPRHELNFTDALDDEGGRLAAFLIGLLVIAGTTFAGADWASRSIRNQLVFEPRRLRLWSAKAIAVSLAGAAYVLITLAGFWLALQLIAQARDLAIPDTELALVGWHVVRAVALGAGAALGAYALTMIFRHTVAALALLFVYAAGSEILVALLPANGLARWTIGNNVFGWLKPAFQYVDPTGRCAAYEECNPVHTLPYLDAGLFLLVLLAGAVVVSVVSFRRRDV